MSNKENNKYRRNSKWQLPLQGNNLFHAPKLITNGNRVYKSYPESECIDLSKYKSFRLPNVNFYKLLINRRSVRRFDGSHLMSLAELGVLLLQSYGVNDHSSGNEPIALYDSKFRNIPSLGSLYPLEIYVVSLKSQLEHGLYHFNPHTCKLEKLKAGNYLERLQEVIHAEPWIEITSSCLVAIITLRHSQLILSRDGKSNRFLIQESGFLIITMSLVLESLDLGSCIVKSYKDSEINAFLGIDGIDESIQSVLIIGKKL